MKRITIRVVVALCTFVVGIIVVASWLVYPAPNIPEIPLVKIKADNPMPPVPKMNPDSTAQQSLLQITPLPCTLPEEGDTQPWIHKSKVLESFPKDSPLPRFIGTFRDKNWNYMLDLYQDTKGVFGELSNPVLDADSPTSRLYDVAFDSRTSALQFSAKFWSGQLQFNGVLRGRMIEATVTQNNRTEKVTLKKLKGSSNGEFLFASRAQFECAMTLWHRL